MILLPVRSILACRVYGYWHIVIDAAVDGRHIAMSSASFLGDDVLIIIVTGRTLPLY